ncbi:hypothetical protein V6N13_072411 [Hibiscus sabdariffa]|uniref:Late embryoproteinsis abundant protein group 8 protein n=1 Tax=Hibiscus sabdariffa TaxID=183260 RepID=A0ABR2R7N4_9ROSI
MGCSSTTDCDAEGKWESEEDEALSLCDLPINLIKEDYQIYTKNEEDGEESQATKTDEDFNFGSLCGSLTTEPEMCAADQVFFQGQILPLRLSVSSDSGITGCRQDSLSTSRCLSRSESMDHGSLSRFTSVSSSSRSSSFNSISNGSSSYYNSKPRKTRNNFNTHPSPKPQITSSKAHQPVNVSSRNQKPQMWEFFRLGLVRGPKLELIDLKARSNNNNGIKNSVSRNSSCNSYRSNCSSSTKNSTTNTKSKIVNKSSEVVKNAQDLSKGFLAKKIGSLSGCKCSVNAVETVPLNDIMVIKSSDNIDAMEDKKKPVKEMKMKKKRKEKRALSRNRTFEWLTEVSHGSYVDEALKKTHE